LKKLLLFVASLIMAQQLHGQSDTTIVLLSEIDSIIVQDVKYATTDNFTGVILYPTAKVYLRKVVAEKLSAANKFAKDNFGYSIKIFDGYRPRSVQYKMWEVYPDPNFVADPKKGSRHNRGAAVDVTLVDKEGKELEMGTPYDTFEKAAHFASSSISKTARRNRDILRSVMVQFGFKGISTEWWHFDFIGWKKFSLLDIPIN